MSRTAPSLRDPTTQRGKGSALNGQVQAQIEGTAGKIACALTVQVPSHDVHHAIEHAATDLAQDPRRSPASARARSPRQVLVQKVWQGASDDGGDREPHRRLVLERRSAEPRVAADRAAGVRVRGCRRRTTWTGSSARPFSRADESPSCPIGRRLEVGAAIEPEVPRRRLVLQELDAFALDRRRARSRRRGGRSVRTTP